MIVAWFAWVFAISGGFDKLWALDDLWCLLHAPAEQVFSPGQHVS